MQAAGCLALHAPPPELRNTSGHALQLARSRYAVPDPRLARERLSASFEWIDRDNFAWYDAARTVLASFELLEEALGDAVAPRLDVLDGDISRVTRGPLPVVPELPPELARQVHAAIVQCIIGTLDQPLDMLKGKTLRQAARSAATRPDAISWLREQQRILGLEYQGLETDR